MGIRRSLADIAATSNRAIIRFVRRNSRLRHLVPASTARYQRAFRSAASEQRRRWAPVEYRTDLTNIYHCCVQKTGSVWIQSILADHSTYRHCGLYHYHYQSRMGETRPIGERSFSEPFPTGSIVSPMYIGYRAFAEMPKPAPYRAFFVMRDPRDLVVSAYFSTLNAHVGTPDILARREALAAMSTEEGLIDTIDRRQANGFFDALVSWRACQDINVKLVRYEELVGPNSDQAFADLFTFLDIRVPEDEFASLLEAYSFTKLTGRERGEERQGSHLRSASPGNWQRHFTPRVSAHFDAVAPDLVADLGYD